MEMKSFILKYASRIMFYDVNIACYQFSSVMEAVSIAWLCGFKSAANRLEFRFEKSFKISHDLRAIDHDRASIMSQMLRK